MSLHSLIACLCVTAALTGSPSVAQPDSFSVRPLSGRPALFHGNDPLVPNMFFNTSWKVEVVSDRLTKALAGQGVRLHQFDVNLDWSADFADKDLSARNGAYRSVDQRATAVLQVDPSALFLFRVHMQPPRSWGEAHPDELLTADDGTRIDTGNQWAAAASYASDAWRADGAGRLTAFVRHLQQSGLEKHVLGFLLFAGWSGEWNWWKPARGNLSGRRFAQLANMCTDHSPAMTRAFQHWVSKRYGDAAALRRAWGKTAEELASFADVRPPTEAEVSAALSRQLNAGPAAQRVADYFACNSAAVTDTLLAFARAAKRAAPHRLCGAFFGEFLFSAIGGNREWLRTGHLDFDRVVRSPDLDFLCTPQAYQSRALGEGAPSMTLADSAALHGKLVFYEFDQPTHLARRDNPSMRDAPQDLAGTRAVLRRAFAYALCHGLGVWWWDQAGRNGTCGPGGKWYWDPDIIAEFGRFQQAWTEALHEPRQSVSEIAALVDLRSPLFQRCTWRDLTFGLVYQQLDALTEIGAPWDVYSLADLGRLRDYKLFIVLNAFFLDDDTRALLQKRLTRPGVSALWYYAPGALRPGGTLEHAASRIGALTGLAVEQLPTPCSLRVKPTAPLAACRTTPFGSERTLDPAFAAAETGGVVLARYEANGRPAVVMKSTAHGVAAYSAVAPLPADVLRFIARAAGCHLYAENGEVVYACRSYVALHTAAPGDHEFRLPRPATLFDVFGRRSLGPPAARFHFTAAGPTTRLYRVLPDR